MDLSRMDAHNKVDIIVKDCLIAVGNVPRCIDDRGLCLHLLDDNFPKFVIQPEDFNGPQFLGGSLSVLALVAESMAKDEPSEELDFEAIFKRSLDLHKKAGLELGVHMSDRHGKMTREETIEALKNVTKHKLGDTPDIVGCGFSVFLADETNPLGLSPKVKEFFCSNKNMVDELVRRGARLSMLAGEHASIDQAFAVENLNTEVTLSAARAIENGFQVYGHDTGMLKKLLSPMDDAEELMGINRKWLNATTKRLSGMVPVKLSN